MKEKSASGDLALTAGKYVFRLGDESRFQNLVRAAISDTSGYEASKACAAHCALNNRWCDYFLISRDPRSKKPFEQGTCELVSRTVEPAYEPDAVLTDDQPMSYGLYRAVKRAPLIDGYRLTPGVESVSGADIPAGKPSAVDDDRATQVQLPVGGKWGMTFPKPVRVASVQVRFTAAELSDTGDFSVEVDEQECKTRASEEISNAISPASATSPEVVDVISCNNLRGLKVSVVNNGKGDAMLSDVQILGDPGGLQKDDSSARAYECEVGTMVADRCATEDCGPAFTAPGATSTEQNGVACAAACDAAADSCVAFDYEATAKQCRLFASIGPFAGPSAWEKGLGPNAKTCKVEGLCTCEFGKPAVGTLCSNLPEFEERCAAPVMTSNVTTNSTTCETGFFYNLVSKTCTPKQCACPSYSDPSTGSTTMTGFAATGEKCPEHGAVHCVRCINGFQLFPVNKRKELREEVETLRMECRTEHSMSVRLASTTNFLPDASANAHGQNNAGAGAFQDSSIGEAQIARFQRRSGDLSRAFWGSVCGNEADDNAADMMCRQAGFADGGKFLRPGSDFLWLPTPRALSPIDGTKLTAPEMDSERLDKDDIITLQIGERREEVVEFHRRPGAGQQPQKKTRLALLQMTVDSERAHLKNLMRDSLREASKRLSSRTIANTGNELLFGAARRAQQFQTPDASSNSSTVDNSTITPAPDEDDEVEVTPAGGIHQQTFPPALANPQCPKAGAKEVLMVPLSSEAKTRCADRSEAYQFYDGRYTTPTQCATLCQIQTLCRRMEFVSPAMCRLYPVGGCKQIVKETDPDRPPDELMTIAEKTSRGDLGVYKRIERARCAPQWKMLKNESEAEATFEEREMIEVVPDQPPVIMDMADIRGTVAECQKLCDSMGEKCSGFTSVATPRDQMRIRVGMSLSQRRYVTQNNLTDCWEIGDVTLVTEGPEKVLTNIVPVEITGSSIENPENCNDGSEKTKCLISPDVTTDNGDNDDEDTTIVPDLFIEFPAPPNTTQIQMFQRPTWCRPAKVDKNGNAREDDMAKAKANLMNETVFPLGSPSELPDLPITVSVSDSDRQVWTQLQSMKASNWRVGGWNLITLNAAEMTCSFFSAEKLENIPTPDIQSACYQKQTYRLTKALRNDERPLTPTEEAVMVRRGTVDLCTTGDEADSATVEKCGAEPGKEPESLSLQCQGPCTDPKTNACGNPSSTQGGCDLFPEAAFLGVSTATTVRVPSLVACMDLCGKRFPHGCRMFTYGDSPARSDYRLCRLQLGREETSNPLLSARAEKIVDALPQIVASVGTTAGLPCTGKYDGCFTEVNKDYMELQMAERMGKTLRFVHSPDACSALCAVQKGCVAFTWKRQKVPSSDWKAVLMQPRVPLKFKGTCKLLNKFTEDPPTPNITTAATSTSSGASPVATTASTDDENDDSGTFSVSGLPCTVGCPRLHGVTVMLDSKLPESRLVIAEFDNVGSFEDCSKRCAEGSEAWLTNCGFVKYVRAAERYDHGKCTLFADDAILASAAEGNADFGFFPDVNMMLGFPCLDNGVFVGKRTADVQKQSLLAANQISYITKVETAGYYQPGEGNETSSDNTTIISSYVNESNTTTTSSTTEAVWSPYDPEETETTSTTTTTTPSAADLMAANVAAMSNALTSWSTAAPSGGATLLANRAVEERTGGDADAYDGGDGEEWEEGQVERPEDGVAPYSQDQANEQEEQIEDESEKDLQGNPDADAVPYRIAGSPQGVGFLQFSQGQPSAAATGNATASGNGTSNMSQVATNATTPATTAAALAKLQMPAWNNQESNMWMPGGTNTTKWTLKDWAYNLGNPTYERLQQLRKSSVWPTEANFNRELQDIAVMLFECVEAVPKLTGQVNWLGGVPRKQIEENEMRQRVLGLLRKRLFELRVVVGEGFTELPPMSRGDRSAFSSMEGTALELEESQAKLRKQVYLDAEKMLACARRVGSANEYSQLQNMNFQALARAALEAFGDIEDPLPGEVAVAEKKAKVAAEEEQQEAALMRRAESKKTVLQEDEAPSSMSTTARTFGFDTDEARRKFDAAEGDESKKVAALPTFSLLQTTQGRDERSFERQDPFTPTTAPAGEKSLGKGTTKVGDLLRTIDKFQTKLMEHQKQVATWVARGVAAACNTPLDPANLPAVFMQMRQDADIASSLVPINAPKNEVGTPAQTQMTPLGAIGTAPTLARTKEWKEAAARVIAEQEAAANVIVKAPLEMPLWRQLETSPWNLFVPVYGALCTCPDSQTYWIRAVQDLKNCSEPTYFTENCVNGVITTECDNDKPKRIPEVMRAANTVVEGVTCGSSILYATAQSVKDLPQAANSVYGVIGVRSPMLLNHYRVNSLPVSGDLVPPGHLLSFYPMANRYGGFCRCPSGHEYAVSSPDGCLTLNCKNGIMKSCNLWEDPLWVGKSVDCADGSTQASLRAKMEREELDRRRDCKARKKKIDEGEVMPKQDKSFEQDCTMAEYLKEQEQAASGQVQIRPEFDSESSVVNSEDGQRSSFSFDLLPLECQKDYVCDAANSPVVQAADGQAKVNACQREVLEARKTAFAEEDPTAGGSDEEDEDAVKNKPQPTVSNGKTGTTKNGLTRAMQKIRSFTETATCPRSCGMCPYQCSEDKIPLYRTQGCRNGDNTRTCLLEDGPECCGVAPAGYDPDTFLETRQCVPCDETSLGRPFEIVPGEMATINTPYAGLQPVPKYAPSGNYAISYDQDGFRKYCKHYSAKFTVAAQATNVTFRSFGDVYKLETTMKQGGPTFKSNIIAGQKEELSMKVGKDVPKYTTRTFGHLTFDVKNDEN
ncbi:unnamed protein product [Amoebophrya sp. A120]|nr:unnamed protein product [Amoebophrya sp. A120]|eukprot:GSA120T00016883001.1